MGSLFKARDHWSVKVGSNEEFCSRSICVANIDNEPNGGEKIIIGSFQGMLRIYNPKQKRFRPEDLAMEIAIGLPILQVSAGRFLPNTSTLALAILTPGLLIIGTVVKQGQTQEGDPLTKLLAFRPDFEHRLERTPYNFCFGQFGGGSGTEQICIQSMDGQLAFYDYNKFLFARFLPSTSFLCPGVLIYIAKMDSFVTCTSTFVLECYRYGAFATSTGSETKEGDRQGRKLTTDWTFNLGEDVVDIAVSRVTKGLANHQVDIIVLCQHTLYTLKETGELRSNRRLDVPPASLCPYLMPDKRSFNLLVGTHAPHSSIQVYNDKNLVWSAKAAATPLFLTVAQMCKIDGMVVMLSDDDTISVNYLGTDPATNPVQILESKELDYDAMDEEQRRLQQVIRQAVNSVKSEPKDFLKMNFDAPSEVSQQRTVDVTLNLQYSGPTDLQRIVVTIGTSDPITTQQATHVVAVLARGESLALPVSFSLRSDADKLIPTSLMAEAIACYTAPTGDSLTTRCHVMLPLGMVSHPIPAVRTNNFQLQLNTNKPPPSFIQLFDDLSAKSSDVQPNVLSLQYVNGMDITVLASKNAGRYRVQAATFEGMWLLSSELIRRLRNFYKNDAEEMTVENPDNLPLPTYFDIVDSHFAARSKVEKAQQALGETAHQFRAIQKRLLVRFRDRNPVPLASLELLFEDTYRRLHASADALDVEERAFATCSNALSCATHLLLLLTRYRYAATFTKEDVDVLKNYLSPIVSSSTAQGWEEVTSASMMHLLRTVLSKNTKESATSMPPLEVPEDTGKLKKHITLVFDRIGKGGSVREAAAAGKSKEPTVVEGKKKKAPEAAPATASA